MYFMDCLLMFLQYSWQWKELTSFGDSRRRKFPIRTSLRSRHRKISILTINYFDAYVDGENEGSDVN